MHLMYLDESGDPGWCPPSPFRWFVLAGLSLEETKWKEANSEFSDVVHNYFGYIPEIDLKYSALKAGASPFDSLMRLQRKNLADEIFNLIIKLKPVLFAIVVDKIRHKAKYGENAHCPKLLALRFMAPRFHKYLERVDGRGIFVMDAEERRADKRLKKLIKASRTFGIVLQDYYDPFRTDTHLPRLIESVLFVTSEESPGIALCDFCSHSIWMHFQRNMSNRYQQIKPLFDRVGSEVYGLKVWAPR